MFPRELSTLEARPACILYPRLPDLLSVNSAVEDGSGYTCIGGIRHTGGTCEITSFEIGKRTSIHSLKKDEYPCTISASTTRQLPNFQLDSFEIDESPTVTCPLQEGKLPSISDGVHDSILRSPSESVQNFIVASASGSIKTIVLPSTSDNVRSSAIPSTSDGVQKECLIAALGITKNETSSEVSEESGGTSPTGTSCPGSSRDSRTYLASSIKSQESIKDANNAKNVTVTPEKSASGDDGLKKLREHGVFYSQESTSWGATQSLRTTAKALRDLSIILKKTADESQPESLISSTTATALSYVATALSDVTVSLSTLLSTSASNYDENNIVIVANAALIAETRAVSLSRYAGKIGNTEVNPIPKRKCEYDEITEDIKSDSDEKQLDESEQTDLDTVFDPEASMKVDGATSQSTITPDKSEKSLEKSLNLDNSSTDNISSKNVDSFGTNYTILTENGYTILETLGTGSFSTVKIANSEKHKCKVAVRIMTKTKVPQLYLDKFLPRVLKVVRVLRHPNIVQFMQVIETTHRVYFVMEYAEHGTLLERIRRDSYILEPIAKKWFRQIAEAVKYLHEQGIAHRDIKCDNLLLDCYDDIKISEFMFSRPNLAPSGGVDKLCETYCGTPEYASPEILRGTPYKPQLSDVWSIGIVLFAMVFGRLPFNEDSFKLLLKKMEGKISFPKKPRVTTPCKNLIGRMLVIERRRISISVLLCDRWFTCSMLPRSAIQQSRDILSSTSNSYAHGKRISSILSPLRRLLRFNAADDCIREESASDSDQYWSASDDSSELKRRGLPRLESCNLPFGLRLCLPSSKRLEQIINQ